MGPFRSHEEFLQALDNGDSRAWIQGGGGDGPDLLEEFDAVVKDFGSSVNGDSADEPAVSADFSTDYSTDLEQ